MFVYMEFITFIAHSMEVTEFLYVASSSVYYIFFIFYFFSEDTFYLTASILN